ncbi:hypothetical protein O6H91_05G105400 [Diphasiastrum complanatum]|uniref:Uncharacterized protein n=1 Tax=Diphasiastrum complanatum TaxID=34168 RepID=A0ACC2DS33_DIPCM|nr:hypothetical protein O6H91_05G105400 [Diphasiastrum complanatum]
MKSSVAHLHNRKHMRFRGAVQLKRFITNFRKLINPLLNKPRYHQLLFQASLGSFTKCLCSGTYEVRKGCLALYVGREHHRFVVPTQYLSHRIFKALLDISAKEFEFRYSNGIEIACKVETFHYLLFLIENNDPSNQTINIADLLDSEIYVDSCFNNLD